MLKKVSLFFRNYQLAIFSGIMIGTSYIPFPPWALFFCFVPLWIYWMQNQNSWKKVFFSGWICQFVLTLIGFNWVAYTLQEFGHIPWPAAVIGLILFCSFASLHIPLGGLLWYFLSKKLNLQHLQKILLLPLCISFFDTSDEPRNKL